MKKIKTAIVALSYMFCAVVSNAQDQQLTLKCEQIGEIKGDQKFSAEDGWLMLTTDLYILNPEAFKGQLETIYTSRKEKDKIKNVFISGQITSTTVAQDVRYPLYNLTVDYVNKELTVNKANTQGKIRIADNIPLNSFGTNPVEMKFYAEAINVEQPQRITDFVCRQLSNVGKVKNDYSAMNKVSEEYGKLLESKTKERQYVFNSTVSLFNELDVDRKVYSICLYQFAPSNQDIERNFSNAALKKCVDDNSNIDYATIRKNVANKTAPIIVAVNYKSSHKPNVRKPNQINDSYVNDRIVKTRNLYAAKLISDDVFTQEDDLNELLKDYLSLDKEVKGYKENKAKGMTNINPSASQEPTFSHFLGIQARRLFLDCAKGAGYCNRRKLACCALGDIHVGCKGDAVAVYEGDFAVGDLVAFGESLVPFVGKVQFFRFNHFGSVRVVFYRRGMCQCAGTGQTKEQCCC